MNEKSVFGTGEWAEYTANIIAGCKHDCKYCYAKSMAIRFHRKTKNNWKDEEVNYEALNREYKKRKKGRVMYPSTHDIHPDQLSKHLRAIESLLLGYDNLLLVSKPHIKCIKAICDIFEKAKDRILFRFTIGSANSDVLKYWEEGAPSFEERLESLKYAFNKGFQTSVSSEPMLDDHIDEVVRQTLPYITDCIWLGKANMLIGRLKFNGITDTIRAKELIGWQSDDKIMELYNRYKDDPKVKWKESIKKVVGIAVPKTKGLDI